MKRKIFTGLIIFMLIIFAGSAYSDFGSFSGNSDYSSSSSSSSSSRSSSSSSSSSSYEGFGGSYSGSRRYRSNSGNNNINVVPLIGGTNNDGGNLDSPEDDEFDECMGVGFVLFVFLIFWLLQRSQSKKKRSLDPVIINRNETVRILKPMNEYLELDPDFDEERIKTLMSNLYVQMQDTWHAKDISSLRPYMTDAFYNQMDRQLEQFRKTNRTDYTERIAVLDVSLKGWRQSAGRDYITVGLTSRIVSYVLDDLTGKLLSGDMNKEKFMEYELELTRKSGVITQPENQGIQTATCPHCGAPLKLNASAQCEYCGSVITNVNTDWAICGMKGISQRTA